MFALQNSNRVHTTQNSQSTKPLPPPTNQKELENRVKEAQLVRAESIAQGNEIRATGKAQANDLRTSASVHGQKAKEAQKSLQVCDKEIQQSEEQIKQAQERNAKFAAILAKKKTNS